MKFLVALLFHIEISKCKVIIKIYQRVDFDRFYDGISISQKIKNVDIIYYVVKIFMRKTDLLLFITNEHKKEIEKGVFVTYFKCFYRFSLRMKNKKLFSLIMNC